MYYQLLTTTYSPCTSLFFLLILLGNIGFDPLQLGKLLCQDNDAKKVVVQSVEIFNGRVAMLATVGMLLCRLSDYYCY